MDIAIIVAHGRNLEIGKNNALPWHLSSDLKYFKKLTTGHSIVMGRKTFESIGRTLPNRENIILTRNKNFKPDGTLVFHSKQELLDYAKLKSQLFIIGGETIYKQFLDTADTLYITKVETNIADADAFFPSYDKSEWTLVSEEKHIKDEKNDADFSFLIYKKNNT
ncbi:MAG: dihydrofolate reductase [Chitinophagaceae bacterium]